MTKPDLGRLIDLQRLLYAYRNVKRVVHHPNHELENDTEHSYALAMTAWYLAPHFPALDRDKVIRYALAHDVVEVHAGDTYVFGDAASLASKHDREASALQRLQTEWPDFTQLTDAIMAYEARIDEEARFIYALDKIMPVMAIYIADGHTWKQEGLTVERLHAVKVDKVALSPEIAPYYDDLHQLLLESPHLIPPR